MNQLILHAHLVHLLSKFQKIQGLLLSLLMHPRKNYNSFIMSQLLVDPEQWKKMLVGILGSSSNLVPIEIMSNSIKEVKEKSFTFSQIADCLKRKDSLNHNRAAKSDFNNYFILPIAALLTKVFLELEETDPFSVATAFFQAMYQFDSEEISESALDFSQTNDHQSYEENSNSSLAAESSGENLNSEISDHAENTKNLFEEEFVHVLQFCQLCHSKKVPPVLYTLIDALSVKEWFSSVKTLLGFNIIPKTLKRVNQNTPSASLDHEQVPKMSRVDDHWKRNRVSSA
jgi:hypothetical protein